MSLRNITVKSSDLSESRKLLSDRAVLAGESMLEFSRYFKWYFFVTVFCAVFTEVFRTINNRVGMMQLRRYRR